MYLKRAVSMHLKLRNPSVGKKVDFQPGVVSFSAKCNLQNHNFYDPDPFGVATYTPHPTPTLCETRHLVSHYQNHISNFKASPFLNFAAYLSDPFTMTFSTPDDEFPSI